MSETKADYLSSAWDDPAKDVMTLCFMCKPSTVRPLLSLEEYIGLRHRFHRECTVERYVFQALSGRAKMHVDPNVRAVVHEHNPHTFFKRATEASGALWGRISE